MIDTLQAKHYGFTEEELDTIINYDIKYRRCDELNVELVDDVVTLGNINLLKRGKVAFLSSRRVVPAAVMAAFDWATNAHGLCVIGGFQSALERDVLKFLLRNGDTSIVLVLARKMWRQTPAEFRPALDDGRMLVVSPVAQTLGRVSEESALTRNRFVLENCASAVFASIDPSGNLARLMADFPDLPSRVIAR